MTKRQNRPSGQGSAVRVLMVTGAYYPELSGGGLQCKSVIGAAGDDVTFNVLTTSTDSELPASDEVDGVKVRRVYVDVSSRWSRLRAGLAFTSAFVAARRSFDLVHLHGFSTKTTLAVILAKLFGKRIVLTLHTAEQDEPAALRARGRLAYWAYSRADAFIAISARMADALLMAGFATERVHRVANGVDTRRFRPAEEGERRALRATLSLSGEEPAILFVGFFSADKGPHVLFDAWRRMAKAVPSRLVFVGATASRYYEVDPGLVRGIRAAAEGEGLASRITFVDETGSIEQFYRAADLFVFPSRREAFGMTLIEAMASGLPCIASRLPGVTDEIVRDGETALLVPPHDVEALAVALARLLEDRTLAKRLGAAARADIASRFPIERTARLTLETYRHALGVRPPAMVLA